MDWCQNHCYWTPTNSSQDHGGCYDINQSCHEPVPRLLWISQGHGHSYLSGHLTIYTCCLSVFVPYPVNIELLGQWWQNIGRLASRQKYIGPLKNLSIEAHYCLEGVGPISTLYLNQGNRQFNVGTINIIHLSANYKKKCYCAKISIFACLS